MLKFSSDVHFNLKDRNFQVKDRFYCRRKRNDFIVLKIKDTIKKGIIDNKLIDQQVQLSITILFFLPFFLPFSSPVSIMIPTNQRTYQKRYIHINTINTLHREGKEASAWCGVFIYAKSKYSPLYVVVTAEVMKYKLRIPSIIWKSKILKCEYSKQFIINKKFGIPKKKKLLL